MSTFVKALLGVATAMLSYLTPKLKQWIDSYISDKAFQQLNSYIDSAIHSKSYLVKKFFSDKKLSEKEIQEFIELTTNDIMDDVTPGMRKILKKNIDVQKYVDNKVRAYIIEEAIKGGVEIEKDKKDN